jgi:hypothetical protein
MKKTYDYGLPNGRYNNSALRISFKDMPLSEFGFFTDAVSLIVVKVEIDYDTRSIYFCLNSDMIPYVIGSSKLTADDINSAINRLDSKCARQLTFIEYSNTGNCLSSETFYCNIVDRESWTFTYEVLKDQTYDIKPLCNLDF